MTWPELVFGVFGSIAACVGTVGICFDGGIKHVVVTG